MIDFSWVVITGKVLVDMFLKSIICQCISELVLNAVLSKKQETD